MKNQADSSTQLTYYSAELDTCEEVPDDHRHTYNITDTQFEYSEATEFSQPSSAYVAEDINEINEYREFAECEAAQGTNARRHAKKPPVKGRHKKKRGQPTTQSFDGASARDSYAATYGFEVEPNANAQGETTADAQVNTDEYNVSYTANSPEERCTNDIEDDYHVGIQQYLDYAVAEKNKYPQLEAGQIIARRVEPSKEIQRAMKRVNPSSWVAVERYVVVGFNGEEALCHRITTYDGEGGRKRGFKADDHVSVYSTANTRHPRNWCSHDPLYADVDEGQKLDRNSLVILSKTYRLSLSEPAQRLGVLLPESLDSLKDLLRMKWFKYGAKGMERPLDLDPEVEMLGDVTQPVTSLIGELLLAVAVALAFGGTGMNVVVNGAWDATRR